jgi:hypothetical protein
MKIEILRFHLDLHRIPISSKYSFEFYAFSGFKFLDMAHLGNKYPMPKCFGFVIILESFDSAQTEGLKRTQNVINVDEFIVKS